MSRILELNRFSAGLASFAGTLTLAIITAPVWAASTSNCCNNNSTPDGQKCCVCTKDVCGNSTNACCVSSQFVLEGGILVCRVECADPCPAPPPTNDCLNSLLNCPE